MGSVSSSLFEISHLLVISQSKMSLWCNLDSPGPPNSASRALGLQVCSPVSRAGTAVMHLYLLSDHILCTAVALWEQLRGVVTLKR